MPGGFVSVPVVPTFKGMSKEFAERLVQPAERAGKQAGKAIGDSLADSIGSLERQAKASSGKLQQLDREYERSVSNRAQQQDKLESATLRLQAAEEKYQQAVAKGGKGLNELAKVKDLKAKVAAETEKLRDAETKIRVAEEKHKDQLEDLNSTLKKLRDTQADATSKMKDSGGVFSGLKDTMGGLAGKASEMGGPIGDVAGILTSFKGGPAAGLAAVGTAAAAAAGAFVKFGNEMAESQIEIQNKLGLTGDAARDMQGEIADALGSGMGDYQSTAESVMAIQQSLGDDMKAMSGQTAADMSDNFMAFSKTFGVGMSEAVSTVDNMINSGLVKNAQEGIDLLTAGFQKVPEALQGEVMDATNEYGKHFQNLGIDGSQAMKMLVDASGQGQIAIDKVGDSLKEFSIRGSDMSKTSVEAYESIGLNAQEMSNKIAQGGDGARDALQQTAEGLLNIEDPAERANAAIALFGTPMEDLSIDQIPTFLQGLADGKQGMGDFAGASQDMADNTTRSLSGMWSVVKGHVQGWWIDITVAVNEGVGKAIGAIADGAKLLFVPLKKAYDAVVQPIVDRFKNFGSDIADSISSRVGTIKDAWGEVTAAFNGGDDGLVALKSIFGEDFARQALDTFSKIKPAWEDLMGLWKGSGDTNGALANLIGADKADWLVEKINSVRDVWSKMVGWVQESAEKLRGIFARVKDFITEQFGKTWESIREAVGKVFESLLKLGESLRKVIFSVVSSLVKILSAVWKILKPIVELLVKVLWPVLKVVGAVIGGVLIAAIGLLMGALRVVAKLIGWVADAFSLLVDYVVGPVIDALSAFVSFIGDKLAVVVDWLADKFGAWVDAVKEKFGIVAAYFRETLWPAIQEVLGWLGEKFQALWDGLVAAWENVIKPVFETIWQVISNTLGVIGAVILTPLILAWQALSAAFQLAWEEVLKPVFEALWMFVSETLWPGLQQAFQWISDGWNVLSEAFQVAWDWIRDNVLVPMYTYFIETLWPAIQQVLQWISDGWNTMKDAISFAWNWIRDNVIQPYIDAFHNLWNVVQSVIGWIGDKWNWLKDIVSAAWAWIDSNVIKPFMAGMHILWTQAVQPVIGWMSDKWNWLKDTMHATYQWIDGNVFTPFRGALDRLKGFFGTVVEGIKTVWNGLKSALAAPINFMINTVYNGGIAKAWDTIGSFLPLKPKMATKLSPIAGFATGGAIRGPGSGTSDDIPAWLSNGEHVWTAKDVLKAGGQQAVYAMREAIQNGQAFSFDGNDLTLLPKHVDNKKGDLLGAAPSLFPAFKDGGEVRPMWELQLERAHKWAKSRSGRPYVLGGSADGAGGTDCSGFMSGIADVIGGGTGARQWATMAFNGGGNAQHPSGPQGFVAGLKAHTFSIGVTNGGAAGGHTAGTLGATSRIGAVNVESGGSPSMVKYGPGAVGANDSYFTTHYHLPIGPGGAFVVGKGSGGPSPEQMKNFILDKAKGAMNRILNPIESMLPSGPPAWKEIPRGVYRAGKEVFPKGIKAGVDALGDGLSTVYEAASEVGDIVKSAGKSATEWAGKKLGLYDTGGILPHGVAAFNHSGEDEFILKNSGMRSLGDLARAVGDLVPALRGHTDMVAKQLDSMQASLAKVADPDSVEGINLRSGIRKVLDLGVDLPGDEVISSILDGEKALWDSRERAIGHVETLKEKEEALLEAKEELAKLESEQASGEPSEDSQKKIDEAQAKLEEAKADQAKAASEDERAKAADKVKEAEENLKKTREDVASSAEDDAKKRAENITKANENVKKAESELAAERKAQAQDLDNIVLVSHDSMKGLSGQARGLANQLIGMGAPAGAVQAGLAGVTGALSQVAGMAGPAGLTLGMVMDALKVAINIVKKIVDFIKGIIEKIRKARIEAYKALADGLSVIADYAKIIVDMQANIAELQQSIVRGLMAQRTAEFNLKVAAQDRLIAEAEGHLKVAEARLKLDEEVRKGAVAAQLKLMGLHEDWDTYMAFQALQSQGVLERWSDAAISALFEYEKARAEALKGELQARVDYINAEAKLAEATRENLRNQQDLLTTQERLLRMSAKVAGVDLEDATGTAQVAKLMAEMAELKGKMDSNTLGRWGYKLGAKGNWANEYRGQMAQMDSLQAALDAVVKETGVVVNRANLDRTLKLMAQASYRGGDPMSVLRAQMPELVAAETALKINESLKPVYEIRDDKREMERKVEDLRAEIDLYEKVTPLEETIKGLEYAIKGLGEKAQAWADGNEKLRGDYIRSAEANEKAAEELGVSWKLDPKYANGPVRDQIRREVTIHMDGEKMYTADQVDKLLAEVTAGTSTRVRVVRPASLVASTKRGEVI